MNLALLWESVLLKNFSCGTFMVVRLLETQDQSKAKAGESAFLFGILAWHGRQAINVPTPTSASQLTIKCYLADCGNSKTNQPGKSAIMFI